MTDSQARNQEAPRRGDAGEDATARDWAGAEDPPGPDEGDATAVESPAAGPAAKAVKAAKATKATKAVTTSKAAKAAKAVKAAKAASAPRKAPAKAAVKAPVKAPVKRKATKAAAAPVDEVADELAHDEAALDQALDQAPLDQAALDAGVSAVDAPTGGRAVPGVGESAATGAAEDGAGTDGASTDGASADGASTDDARRDGALGEAVLERDGDLPDDQVRAEVAHAEVAQDGPFAGSPAGPDVDAPAARSDDAPTDAPTEEPSEPSGLSDGDVDASVGGVRADASDRALAASLPADSATRSAAPPVTSAEPPATALVGSRVPSGGATTTEPTAPAAAPDPEPEPDADPDLEPPRQIVRATGPARRPPLIVQGLWPALLAGGLVAATYVGLLPLAVAVLGVQVFLVLGTLALLDAPASGGAFIVATGTTLAADAVVLADDGRVTGLAGVAALGLVAALLHQLLRKARSRVTESLADTLVVIVGSVAAACLLALRQVEGGEEVLLVSLAAAGAVLLAGRIGDRIVPLPVLAVGATRGWPGLLLGLGAGVAAAVLVADLSAPTMGTDLPLRSAALLGLVIASTVATADLAVDLGAAELRAGWRDARRVAALRPTALLLPYAVVGPVALLAGRLVLP